MTVKCDLPTVFLDANDCATQPVIVEPVGNGDD